MLRHRGAFAEAELLRRRGLEAQERLLGPEHPETLTAMYNLAGLLLDLGRLSEAQLLRRAVQSHAAFSVQIILDLVIYTNVPNGSKRHISKWLSELLDFDSYPPWHFKAYILA